MLSLNQVYADYLVEGNIKNAETGKPVKSVNIYIRNLNSGTISDVNGDFSIKIPSLGKTKIEFSHIGYESIYLDTISDNILDIKMKSVLVNHSDVVVTSMRSEYALSDVPVFTEVINKKDIEESGAISIADLMEQRAGVSKEYNFDGSFNYKLLGLDSKYILILKDGQPITGRFNDKVDLDQLTVSNINRVEIIKGPGSALYGTEAMGGIINILTDKDIKNKMSSEIRYRGTSYDKKIASIDGNFLSLNLNNPFKVFSVNTTLIGQRLANNNGYNPLGRDIINKVNFDTKLFWKSRNEKQSIGLSLSYFERLDSSKISTSTGIDISNNSTKIERKQLAVEYKYIISDKSSLKQVYNNSIYRRHYKQDGVDSLFFKNDITDESSSDYELSLINKWSKTTLSGGLEYSIPRYESDRIKGAKRSLISRAFFIQSEYKISDLASVISGIRYDKYDNNKVFSPRFAYLFKPSNYLKYRLSYGEGFRAPSFIETLIDFYNIENGYKVEGNSTLKAERSKGITMNIEYSNKNNFQMSALVYQNIFSNKIATQQVQKISLNDPIVYKYGNISNATYSGFELVNNFLISNRTSSKLTFNIRNNYDGDGLEIPNFIPISIGTKLSHTFLTYKIKFIFNLSTNYRQEGDSFQMADIQLRKNIKNNLSINVGMKNLSNYTDDNFGPYVGRSIYFEIIK